MAKSTITIRSRTAAPKILRELSSSTRQTSLGDQTERRTNSLAFLDWEGKILVGRGSVVDDIRRARSWRGQVDKD